MYHRQDTEHHSLIPGGQVIQHLLGFFSLQLHIVRNHGRKVIVCILPSLPVRDICLHTKQTFFHFLYCFISRNRNHINTQHQISIHVGQFCYHIVFDVRSILTKKKYPSITISHAEIIFFKFKGIRTDIIFEAVSFFRKGFHVKWKTLWNVCLEKDSSPVR